MFEPDVFERESVPSPRAEGNIPHKQNTDKKVPPDPQR